jgi:hypothetical protein
MDMLHILRGLAGNRLQVVWLKSRSHFVNVFGGDFGEILNATPPSKGASRTDRDE